MPPRRARQSAESIEAAVRGDNAADITGVYDAPFLIYSEAEGERYMQLHTKGIEVPTFFNFEVLDQIGLTGRLMTLYRRGGWEYFVRINYPVYRDLTLKFFTSLRFVSSKPDKLWCRLRGRMCLLDDNMLRSIFGFAQHDIGDGHQSFSTRSYWKYLTDLDEYDPHLASNAQILNAELKLLHKFICGVVFGKRKSTKCSSKELFLLWYIEHGHKPNMFAYVSRTLTESVGRKGNSLCMDYLATALAEHCRVDLSELNMLRNNFFDVSYLKRREIIDDKTMQLRDPSTRTALKRKLTAAESSSRCNAPEYGSETEGQQQPPQQLRIQQPEHEQQPQPDLGMFYDLIRENQKLMVDQHRGTQQRLDILQQQMKAMHERMCVFPADLNHMGDRLEKAWQVQGLDMPPPTSSSNDTTEGSANDPPQQ